MSKARFYIVDVFAEQKYAGNQLAVIRGAGGLATEAMQALALEMNYSETTFIVSEAPRDGGYDVRIFTPAAEIPFAGHPTLGTATVIREKLLGGDADRVSLNLGIGPVEVTFEQAPGGGALAWMHPRVPALGDSMDARAAASLLGLQPGDIDRQHPVQWAEIGISFLIVPLQSLAALKRAALRLDRWLELIGPDAGTVGVLLFCRETHEEGRDLAARMFFEAQGLREDPATGSANACLAAYLAVHRFFGSNAVDVRVEQGYEILRPSLLYLRSRADGGEVSVSVGGRSVFTAEGELV